MKTVKIKAWAVIRSWNKTLIKPQDIDLPYLVYKVYRTKKDAMYDSYDKDTIIPITLSYQVKSKRK